MNPVRSAIHAAGRWYVKRLCQTEADHQVFSNHNERSLEYGFALQALSRSRPKSVLDVGTGTTAWPHILRNCGFLVQAIDNVRDYWPKGMLNRHWKVLDVDITNIGTFEGKFEAITCISVLEHIQEHNVAMRNMFGLLEPGGSLILTCPYNHHSYSANVYERSDALYGQDAPYVCQSYSKEELSGWLDLGFECEKRELWRLFSGSVWATGKRTDWSHAESESEPHQLGMFVLRKQKVTLP